MAKFEQINFVNGQSPYLSKKNLNEMQTRINQALQAPVGSIEINDGVDPSTYNEGTWEKQKMFLGGELIAFATIYNTKTNTNFVDNGTHISLSDTKIPNKVAEITNYIDGILSFKAGALAVNPKNVAGIVEAKYAVSGLAGSSCEGLWFWGNENPLIEGVSLDIGDGSNVLYNLIPNKYGGANNDYIYKIDDIKVFSDDDFFFVNPAVTPYNGNFCPCSGGTKCYLTAKVFAKKGATIWKRVS